MKKFSKIILLTLLFSAGTAAQSVDFIILSDPQTLIIYDKYQHKLPAGKRQDFPARTPMKVLETATYLSDQYTHVMKTSYNGSEYFLELNNEHQIITIDHSAAENVLIYSGCRELSDTLQLATPSKVRLRIDPGKDEDSRPLETGDLLTTVFRHKNNLFVKTQGRVPEYGWLPVSDKKHLQTIHVNRARQSILFPERIRKQIVERFDEINKLYIRYFSFMNERYNQYKSTPMWDVRIGPSSLTSTLTLPEYANILTGSTQYLIQELEGYLIGTPFKVYAHNGVIEIRV